MKVKRRLRNGTKQRPPPARPVEKAGSKMNRAEPIQAHQARRHGSRRQPPPPDRAERETRVSVPYESIWTLSTVQTTGADVSQPPSEDASER